MKNLLRLFISQSLLLILYAYPAFTSAQILDAGINLGSGSGIKNINSGFGLELNIGYSLNEEISLRINGGVFSSEFDVKNATLSGSTYLLSYFEGTLLYNIVIYPTVFIYGGGGIGYYFPRMDYGSHHGIPHPGVSVKKDFEDAPGLY